MKHSDQFVRVVTEKMLTYALGRGLEYQDMPMVRSIVRDSANDNYKFSSIIMGIVKSPAFQMNMKMPERRAAGARASKLRRKTADMFITKKHMSRRTVLRGTGAALALPLAGCHDSGLDRAGANSRGAEASLCGLLRAARRGARLLGPGKGGRARRRRFLSTGSRWSRSRSRR